MPIVPGATACLTILFLRCRPKAQATRTYPTPKSLGPKKQNMLIIKPPFCPIPIKLSSIIAKKRRRSIERKSKIRKTLFRPPETMPLRVKKAIKNSSLATGDNAIKGKKGNKSVIII